MAEEISYLSEEIQKICTEIRKGLDGLSKLKKKPEERDEKIGQLQERLARAKDVYSNYRMELRDVLRECGRVAYTEWEAKGHKHHQSITALAQELEVYKANVAKADLMQGATKGAAQKKDKNDANTWAGNEVIGQARKVQEESKSAVARSAKLVEKMETTGADTAVALKAQTDQMRSINEDVQQVDQSLNRADKLIRDIARRLATDKMIIYIKKQPLQCLVLVLMVAIIAYCLAFSPPFSLIVVKSAGLIPGAAAIINCGILQTLSQCNQTNHATTSVAQTPVPSSSQSHSSSPSSPPSAPPPPPPSPPPPSQVVAPSNPLPDNSSRRFLEMESFAPFTVASMAPSSETPPASKDVDARHQSVIPVATFGNRQAEPAKGVSDSSVGRSARGSRAATRKQRLSNAVASTALELAAGRLKSADTHDGRQMPHLECMSLESNGQPCKSLAASSQLSDTFASTQLSDTSNIATGWNMASAQKQQRWLLRGNIEQEGNLDGTFDPVIRPARKA